MVNVGDKAPELTLKLSDNENINLDFSLSDAYNQGLTILYFFPAAFTRVCTKSSCEIREDILEFTTLHSQIYGISVDSPFVLKKFHSENNLNYPLLSDWNKNAIESFGIIDDNFAGGLRGFAKRSLFAIDKGHVIYKWIAESPGNYPPFDELKQKLYRHHQN